MSNLRRLIEQANSSFKSETTPFDELEDEIQDLATNSLPINDLDLTQDGQSLQVGDPVVGIHQGYDMSGEVIAVNGDNITVLWKDRTQSTVKANTLKMTDVDSDYEEQAMYIESYEPTQNLGFDKESFNEDTDLYSLLHGDDAGSSNYDLRGDL